MADDRVTNWASACEVLQSSIELLRAELALRRQGVTHVGTRGNDRRLVGRSGELAGQGSLRGATLAEP